MEFVPGSPLEMVEETRQGEGEERELCGKEEQKEVRGGRRVAAHTH